VLGVVAATALARSGQRQDLYATSGTAPRGSVAHEAPGLG
jgi:hypothetical protein